MKTNRRNLFKTLAAAFVGVKASAFDRKTEAECLNEINAAALRSAPEGTRTLTTILSGGQFYVEYLYPSPQSYVNSYSGEVTLGEATVWPPYECGRGEGK